MRRRNRLWIPLVEDPPLKDVWLSIVDIFSAKVPTEVLSYKLSASSLDRRILYTFIISKESIEYWVHIEQEAFSLYKFNRKGYEMIHISSEIYIIF